MTWPARVCLSVTSGKCSGCPISGRINSSPPNGTHNARLCTHLLKAQRHPRPSVDAYERRKRSLTAGSDVHSPEREPPGRPAGAVAPGDKRFGNPSPRSVGPDAPGHYRSPDRRAPRQERCQLLVEHYIPAHISKVQAHLVVADVQKRGSSSPSFQIVTPRA